MAKKKTVRRASKPPILAHLQSNLKQLQRDAESVLRQARKETARLGQDQKRALQRVVNEARGLRRDFEGVVKQTSKDLEARSKQFLATLQKEAARRLDPVLKQLSGRDAGVRDEVQKLSRRVQELEKIVKGHAREAAPPPSTQPSLFPPDAAPPVTPE